ncbi:hypothetical protein EB796_014304 [Bugula neritina]|uniref:Uncharacterized protein n=1 Tax=Bugula neritina TaxID=10212 RepID=A0A7J7JP53_BUGNE|nr:hypothetical protein EB796_014304 [Bugula neritina]
MILMLIASSVLTSSVNKFCLELRHNSLGLMPFCKLPSQFFMDKVYKLRGQGGREYSHYRFLYPPATLTGGWLALFSNACRCHNDLQRKAEKLLLWATSS